MSAPDQTPAPANSRAILGIALPSMLTNVATALFGLADMWVIGRLGDPAAQGGVEVGAKLLMTLLVVFNFLRSGTVALAAQASGRGDEPAQAAALTRGLAVALAIGAILLALRGPLVALGLTMLGAHGRVAGEAGDYVGIRYWGSVPWLLNAVLVGWLIGRRKVRAVLAVEVGANLFHIALDLSLVLGLRLGVAGVAVATLSSETAKLLALAAITAGQGPARRALGLAREASTWRPRELMALFRLNRDLFARTVLLMVATVILTRAGVRQGAVVLAANAILYQMFMLAALLLDGFESAAQVLCGEAVGAGRRAAFEADVRSILLWAGGFAALLAGLFGGLGARLAASFSTDPGVVAATGAYAGWAAVLPLVGVVSFVFDGVFIGAGWTRAMLVTMTAALAVFVLALPAAAAAGLGNNGLWLAFSLFLAARAAGQAICLPGLARRAFAGRPA
jgi:MATE family multidrug resistance protein